jgi:glycosyltransferase involved in cell wall biosynthesis
MLHAAEPCDPLIQSMRLLYLGHFSPTFPRNAILRHGLEQSGVEVIVCRLPDELAPAHSTGPGRSGVNPRRVAHELGLLLRTLRRWLSVVRVMSKLPGDIDAIIVAEFNQGLMPLVAPFARRRGIPVVLDLLISLWDTAVNSRRTLKPNRPRALLRWLADKSALSLADAALFDTVQQADYYTALFSATRSKARILPVGCAEWRIVQTPPPVRGAEERRLVLFYGSFAPVHGVEWILRAAHELEADPRFFFRLVGVGQQHDELVKQYGGGVNVEFRPPKRGEIGRLIAKADICLGSFGEVDIGARVVPTKVWECLCAGRPVITADGPGPRSVFESERHLLLVPPANPDALAAALTRLVQEPELGRRLADEGAALVRSRYSSVSRGAELIRIVDSIARKAK